MRDEGCAPPDLSLIPIPHPRPRKTEPGAFRHPGRFAGRGGRHTPAATIYLIMRAAALRRQPPFGFTHAPRAHRIGCAQPGNGCVHPGRRPTGNPGHLPPPYDRRTRPTRDVVIVSTWDPRRSVIVVFDAPQPR